MSVQNMRRALRGACWGEDFPFWVCVRHRDRGTPTDSSDYVSFRCFI